MIDSIEIDKYIAKKKELYDHIIDFLENDDNNENNFDTIVNLIQEQEILENDKEIKNFLYLISRISSNHYRTINFISKIEQIILHISEYMKNRH